MQNPKIQKRYPDWLGHPDTGSFPPSRFLLENIPISAILADFCK
jgi:hypothetical protein